MRFAHFGVVLAAGLACVLSVQPTGADLYQWIDENGTTNISDKPPKDRSLIVEVFPTAESSPPSGPVPPALTDAAQQLAELRALSQRVERLARQLEEERRAFDAAQPVALPQYAAPPPPMSNGIWFEPPFFAPATVVFSVPFAHGIHHTHKFGHAHKFRHVQGFRQLNKFHHVRPVVIQSHPNAVLRAGGIARFHAPRASFRMR
ncbi:MAG: hypothetical protein A3G24_19850 [Betaproteobacteria bacterium RIFCSPLOWO2_12_FULL_62_13]|nr:MAG: hypothetical protein A3G24_19850 [Betaproteobacteria bacterium RIFCSPLOWO2_12_FULL_62_13]